MTLPSLPEAVRSARLSRLATPQRSMQVLRQAVAADIPGIWEVRYSVAENTLTPGRITDEQVREAIEVTGQGWVIEDRGMIQAFAVGTKAGNVWALFVRPEAQGRGYGTQLHRELLSWFSTQPIAMLWLSTGTQTRARSFYEKYGWRCVGPYGEFEVKYERPNAANPFA